MGGQQEMAQLVSGEDAEEGGGWEIRREEGQQRGEIERQRETDRQAGGAGSQVRCWHGLAGDSEQNRHLET